MPVLAIWIVLKTYSVRGGLNPRIHVFAEATKACMAGASWP